jgi:hypothetical protein
VRFAEHQRRLQTTASRDVKQSSMSKGDVELF